MTIGAEHRPALSVKRDLGGVAYSADPPDALHAALCGWLRGERRGAGAPMVGYVNPHVFNIAWRDAAVRDFLAAAEIVAVDGVGSALGATLLNAEWTRRTVMTPLFDRVLATDDLPPLTAVLVGGDAAVAARAAEAMNAVGGRIRVTSWMDGFRPVAEYVESLRAREPFDLLLVGMGTPRSERLLLAARDAGVRALGWSIGGGTIHYYAGSKRRVPRWVSAAGVQWVYRMVHEPATIRRYVVGIPEYLVHLAEAAAGRRAGQPARGAA